MKKILIIAGEPSSDLHAANLIMELRKKDSSLIIMGVGGEKMKNAGAVLLHNITDFASIGIFEVMPNFYHLYGIYRKLSSWIAKEKPDLIIPLDFPDFNLKICETAFKCGIPVAYYISPQVWAWRKGRIRKIKKFVGKMMVILPFEEEFYRRNGIDSVFVGHPILDSINPEDFCDAEKMRQELGLEKGKKIIGVLPGSRKHEIRRLLPVLVKAMGEIRRGMPEVEFIISCASNLDEKALNGYIAAELAGTKVFYDKTHKLIGASDLLLAVSGTVTLEAALIGTPMIAMYSLALPTWLLLRPFVRVQKLCLVNIIADKMIVPEIFQWNFTPGQIASKAIQLMNNPDELKTMKLGLGDVARKFGMVGASAAAAEEVLKMLK